MKQAVTVGENTEVIANHTAKEKAEMETIGFIKKVRGLKNET